MFVVLKVTAIPDHLRGYVGRFLQEATTGLYVGKTSTKVADLLWESVCAASGTGAAVMICSTNNDTGFTLRTQGQLGWEVRSYDGIDLPVQVTATGQSSNSYKEQGETSV